MPCGVYILVWGSVNGRADRLTERTKGTVGGTKKKERRKERNRKPYRHEVIERRNRKMKKKNGLSEDSNFLGEK